LVYVGSEALPVPQGVAPELMDRLAAELERVLATEQPRATQAETTDYIVPRRYNLNGDAVLSWEYKHTGDYNQDGLVSVNDITPIGQNYNAAYGEADWASAWLADGNGDGLVTVNDITPIGQNYQEALRSYVIEAADSAEGPWTEIGRCPFEAAVAPSGGGKLWFSYLAENGAATGYYRVAGDDQNSGVEAEPPAPQTRRERFSSIRHFMYQIQGLEVAGAVDALAATHYDLLVLEPTSTFVGEESFDTASMVARLKASDDSRGGNKLVIAYVDVGQAEDYRTYWQAGWIPPTASERGEPDFLITVDPDGWSGNYPVAYWDQRWIDIMIDNPDSVLNQIIDAGFEGIYMDWVEAYDDEYVIAAALDDQVIAADEMVDFIDHLRTVAQARDPEFLIVQQNAPFLIEESTGLAEVIDGLSMEDTWFLGQADVDWGDPLGGDFPQDAEGYTTELLLDAYQLYQAEGIPVWTVDYCLEVGNAVHVYNESPARGLVPLVTQTSLMGITETPPPVY
jgi:cysteinyl-tRNA synthetase